MTAGCELRDWGVIPSLGKIFDPWICNIINHFYEMNTPAGLCFAREKFALPTMTGYLVFHFVLADRQTNKYPDRQNLLRKICLSQD